MARIIVGTKPTQQRGVVGRQGFTDPRSGRLSHGGRMVTRNQKYRDIRRGFGLSAG